MNSNTSSIFLHSFILSGTLNPHSDAFFKIIKMVVMQEVLQKGENRKNIPVILRLQFLDQGALMFLQQHFWDWQMERFSDFILSSFSLLNTALGIRISPLITNSCRNCFSCYLQRNTSDCFYI